MIVYHESVLLKEAVEHLKIKDGRKYIDCTLGDAGHTIEILKNGGLVLGIDQDPQGLERAKARVEEAFNGPNPNFKPVLGNFKNVADLAQANGFERVDGVLYDIGTSFVQLSDVGRGFSFDSTAELDMRMSPDLSLKASDLVNALSEKELTKLIFDYGEDKFAHKIAKAVVKARKEERIQTCRQLTQVIESVVPRFKGVKIHPATRTFQALRIAVNDELNNFDISLSKVATEPLVIPGGRLVIITFHSLEDKLAKVARPGLREILRKPLTASPEEIKANYRARSAKLRVYEKI